MEDAKDIGAGVDNREASVVCCQNPVGAVGSNWEQKTKKVIKLLMMRAFYSLFLLLLFKFVNKTNLWKRNEERNIYTFKKDFFFFSIFRMQVAQ